ncbi:MAG: radical SAM protein [Candidatus Bathyarchaeia archaeon]
MTENCQNLPSQTRVSLGTAIVLGLLESKLDAAPTTAYLMTYKQGKCTANCGFCPQAKGSKSRTELLSRVTWPSYPTEQIINALWKAAKDNKFQRICIQALNYPNMFLHLEVLIKEIKKTVDVPVSVSCQPLNGKNIHLLKSVGVDRIGIALDAATEPIFCKIKGSEVGGMYSWSNEIRLLEEALTIFGVGHVSTHLIVGLGETEQDVACLIQRCVAMGVLPALFAFTPVRGTALENLSQPSLDSYRRVQLARYLLVHGKTSLELMRFDANGKIVSFGVPSAILEAAVNGGVPFQTSGCPDCNRPFYNEKPSGPMYNYPKELNKKEIEEIKRQLSV